MNTDEGGSGVLPIGGGFYPNPMNMYGSIGEITDTQELMYKLELNLGGKDLVNNVVVDRGDPLMNSKGIKDIMMVMRSFCDRVEIMSHFEKSSIKMLMEYLNDTLCRNLMLNRINYGFDNPGGRDLVVSICNFSGFAIINRGKEGGERRFWKGSINEQMIKTDDKRGFLGGLFKK